MQDPKISFVDNDTPLAEAFGDIYFSKDNGLEETDYVFLKGNGLPEAWEGYQHIRVCETGFGTGLNFLATARLFEQTAKAGQKLFYTAIEKHPLPLSVIERSLAKWRDQFGTIYDRYLDQYPLRIQGFHPIQISDSIFLVLIFDDIEDALPALQDLQDFWFLDGFAPAQNPSMWQDVLYQNMQRLSHCQTRFATFTAAGLVKRGLEAHDFETKRIKGYGRKREMLVGHYNGEALRKKEVETPLNSIIIAGAGLAGLSIAWFLNSLGCSVKIEEKNPTLGQNASGNQLGLINPRIGAERIPAFDFYNAAFALFTRMMRNHISQIGAYHFAPDEDKDARFTKFQQTFNWPEEVCTASSFQNKQGLFFAPSATINPSQLCQYYATNLEITFDTESQDAAILATSHDLNNNAKYNFPLQKIRGQVSYASLKEDHPLYDLKHSLSMGSYVAPLSKSEISFGATFQHWADNDRVTDTDHNYNLEKLALINPSYRDGLTITGGWAGFRCASKDRLPLIGSYDGIYVSVAHGSHGVISSLAGALIIAYDLGLIPQPFSKTVLEAVSPQRYNNK